MVVKLPENQDACTNTNSNHASASQRRVKQGTASESIHNQKLNEENEEDCLDYEDSRVVVEKDDSCKSDYLEQSNKNGTDRVEFCEEGEIIEMEIDDGSAATEEFASKPETDSEQEDLVTEAQEKVSSKMSNKTKRNVTKSRPSIEDRLESLSDALFGLKNMFEQKGFMDSQPYTSEVNRKKQKIDDKGKVVTVNSASSSTIYRNVLKKVADQVEIDNEPMINAGTKEAIQETVDSEITFRIKPATLNEAKVDSSSDKQIDTSDELMEVDMDINDRFIADCQQEAKWLSRQMGNNGFANNEYDDTQILQENQKRKSLEIADKMIREAEASRAKIFKTPGNESNYIHTSLVDDNYMVIGAHVDLLTQDKIKKGEYVDFSKLLPKDRSYGEDQQMELVNRGGQSFFIPAEKDSGSITNFNKWEQAFRIYMNVYSRQHPSRASELIQYNHIIFTAASTYLWDNVYTYDKEFRMHMANYPNRNWSVILQQAWTMYLKDRIRHDNKNPNFGGSFKKHKEECKRLN